MSNLTSFEQLEGNIRAVIAVPQARAEFVDQLHANLMQRAAIKKPFTSRPFYLRPVWMAFMAVVAIVILSTLIIGPRRVYAAVLRLFGYIPGVGIVDQSAPIRVLAEPVSITRDGVTVSVNSLTLTGVQTIIDYGVSGVPLSASPQSPQQEAVQYCPGPDDFPYLRLPDGSKLMFNGNTTGPIPSDVQEATFVLPCIFNTLPGTVPTDWELPLRFIAAPPDLTVLPVIGVTPTVSQTETATATVSVEQVIQTEDGYILIGKLHPQLPEGSWLQVTGMPVIQDAGGENVPYTIPNDVQSANDGSLSQGGFSWAFQIKAAGVAFPLTIRFTGVAITQADPQATAELVFDAGPNPTVGQEWQINQDVQLGLYSLKLISISAGQDGYSFRIRPGTGMIGASVQIDGYQAVGAGGGGSDGARVEEYTTSLVYTELPKGRLTIIFSNPMSASAPQTWQGQWQPEVPRSDWPTPPAGLYPVCVKADSFQALSPLPNGLDGRALVTKLNPDTNLVLESFDGSQRQVLVQNGSRGVLSPDGQRLAYPDSDGIKILELSSGKITLLSNLAGYSLRWSPDGQQIAFVTSGGPYGIFVASTDGSSQHQLTNLGYESIAGWSLDGTQLYYAIPGSSNNGFLLKAMDVASGQVHDLFVLENSSRKAPLPTVSPDGNWIAYRGSDNGSLYIIRMDGTQARLVIEKPSGGYAISGIVWGPGGDLIGVSMITPEDPDGEIILVHWEGCEAYQITTLHGELDGLLIP